MSPSSTNAADQQQSNASASTAAGDTPEQRIARYKELRRQQLREGVAAVLDKERAAKNERSTPSRSAITKRAPRQELPADPITSPRVRTTRASRLRQAASSTSKTSLPADKPALVESSPNTQNRLAHLDTNSGRLVRNKGLTAKDDQSDRLNASNLKSPLGRNKFSRKSRDDPLQSLDFSVSNSPKSTASESSPTHGQKAIALVQILRSADGTERKSSGRSNKSLRRHNEDLLMSISSNTASDLTSGTKSIKSDKLYLSDNDIVSSLGLKTLQDVSVVESSDTLQSPVAGPSGVSKYGSEENLDVKQKCSSLLMGDHLSKKDKSSKRKNSFNMAPNIVVAEDANVTRRSRRLLTSSNEHLHRRSPQRSASLSKPSRSIIKPNNESKVNDNQRVDALTQRTKEALLKVERLKIRRVASTKVVEKKAMTEVEEPKPISILKRKSGTCTLPVTFSPEVVLESEKSEHASRQGILKKRLSMEEVPNVQLSDTRGRRSSLDITAKTGHHGILKRRTSRSEDEDSTYVVDDAGDSPPHGILKGGISTEDCCAMRPILKRRSHSEDHREQSRDLSPEPHHGILKKASDHSGLSYSEGCLQYQLSQTFDPVKPILKKKSLSEESAAASSLDLEAPRPILKKKSSTESDEADEYKPRRPILKTSSKTSSRRDSPKRDSPRRGFNDTALPQDLAAALNEVVQRRNSTQNLQRTKSAAAADSELASILLKRRSVTDEQVECNTGREPVNGNDSQSDNSNQRNSPSPTAVTESIAERISRLVGGASAVVENGAVPRRRAADRFRTQPVTFNEMVALNEDAKGCSSTC